ncbi:MAG TPA: beta-propeller fold lactonase family protein, partial [Ferruginibacter sp.]|nr:beta-propeller fold lactonase family protein [Ferruginibacter sp.]
MKHRVYLTVLLLFFVFITAAQDQHYLITGSYTSGKSEGIYVYLFNSSDGSYKEVSHAQISNPSFVAVSPDERFVYAVQENAANKGRGGEIAAFSFNKRTGTLTYINEQASGGDHPCYVSVDRTGKWVAAGNYSSGSVAILPVQA